MNNRNIDRMIPIAMRVIKGSDNLFKKGKIESKYNGYLAAMGATIITSGLVQTLTFYSQESSESDRKDILEIILEVLNTSGIISEKIDNIKRFAEKFNSQPTSAKHIWRMRVGEAIIACKLAIRTFSIDKGEEDKPNE